MNREDEMQFILNFVKDHSQDQGFEEQLRCLWTAYCFHHDLEVDTSEYDKDFSKLWDEMKRIVLLTEYGYFENFMCEYLV